MSKEVEIDGKRYPTPEGYDSTKHNLSVKDGKVIMSDKTSNASSTNTNENKSDAPNKKEQSEKTSTGKSINLEYALVDETSEDVISTNSGNFKISIFLAKKFEFSDSNFEQKNNIPLKYQDTVQNIYLVDDISSIGLSGYIDVINTGSYLDLFIGRHNNYYLVINFTEYDEIGKTPKTKYEPYIFDISYVQNLSSPDKEKKILRIGLVDIITSILKSHSIASVIKQHKEIVKAFSYKEVFSLILTYVKNHIRINTNNKYDFKKDLLYNSDTLCMGNIFNGNDMDADMSELVRASFVKISRNATIYEAMNQLIQDSCTTMKTPAGFKEKYMEIGDVLIPFFFREEYADNYGIYHAIWGGRGSDTKNGEEQSGTGGTEAASSPLDTTTQTSASGNTQTQPVQTSSTPTTTDTDTENNTSKEGHDGVLDTLKSWQTSLSNANSEIAKNKKNTQNVDLWLNKQQYGGKAEKLRLRQITMRDIYMPFFLAFGSDKYTGVYENINPNSENKDNCTPINGVYQKEILALQFNPIDMNTVRKIWKNVVFLDTSGDGGNSILIFFSWFFDYFQNVFLKSDPNAAAKEGFRVSNVQPTFHLLSKNEKIAHATSDGGSFSNLFDEYNAYTYATETEDVVGECLRLMGKNLASFVLLNDSYIFKLNGQMLRRPNEIVKFGFRGSKGATMQELSMHTDINFGEYTYLYVKKVTHQFQGNNYYNEITGCKICEVLSI